MGLSNPRLAAEERKIFREKAGLAKCWRGCVGGTVLVVSRYLSQTKDRMRGHTGKVNDELLPSRPGSEGKSFIVLRL